jgi:hypothetical protein
VPGAPRGAGHSLVAYPPIEIPPQVEP